MESYLLWEMLCSKPSENIAQKGVCSIGCKAGQTAEASLYENGEFRIAFYSQPSSYLRYPTAAKARVGGGGGYNMEKAFRINASLPGTAKLRSESP